MKKYLGWMGLCKLWVSGQCSVDSGCHEVPESIWFVYSQELHEAQKRSCWIDSGWVWWIAHICVWVSEQRVSCHEQEHDFFGLKQDRIWKVDPLFVSARILGSYFFKPRTMQSIDAINQHKTINIVIFLKMC